jgi:hypothetical protein
MMRLLGPVFFVIAAAYVRHYNGTHDDTALLFPLVSLIPGVETLEEQKVWSVYTIAGIGGVWAAIEAVLLSVRMLRSRDAGSASE